MRKIFVMLTCLVLGVYGLPVLKTMAAEINKKSVIGQPAPVANNPAMPASIAQLNPRALPDKGKGCQKITDSVVRDLEQYNEQLLQVRDVNGIMIWQMYAARVYEYCIPAHTHFSRVREERAEKHYGNADALSGGTAMKDFLARMAEAHRLNFEATLDHEEWQKAHQIYTRLGKSEEDVRVIWENTQNAHFHSERTARRTTPVT